MSEWDDVRHGATVHMVAQLALIGAAQACHALKRAGIMGTEDLQPIHDAWRQMDEKLRDEIPGDYRYVLRDAIDRFPPL
jgi:hypothetical protein